jgi:hypothetical protein
MMDTRQKGAVRDAFVEGLGTALAFAVVGLAAALIVRAVKAGAAALPGGGLPS